MLPIKFTVSSKLFFYPPRSAGRERVRGKWDNTFGNGSKTTYEAKTL
jgi:hypothetical protein